MEDFKIFLIDVTFYLEHAQKLVFNADDKKRKTGI